MTRRCRLARVRVLTRLDLFVSILALGCPRTNFRREATES